MQVCQVCDCQSEELKSCELTPVFSDDQLELNMCQECVDWYEENHAKSGFKVLTSESE
jgi:hypothetical protein